MKVADFFCGSGGFSEGFRQAGFEIAFAVDKWMPAVKTFNSNKSKEIAICDDVVRLSNLPTEEFDKLIPDTEIIIGSPPCVAFSNSNKSGKADKSLGLELVHALFRIIVRKKYKKNSILKYWILENVPNIEKHLTKTYSCKDLKIDAKWGIDSDVVLKPLESNTGVYNAKFFGAPTNRKRYFCGEFPKPIPTHNSSNVITLEEVLSSLGTPLSKSKDVITDICNPDFSMNTDQVTDHQYLYKLEPFEWEKAKRLKQDRGYMGKMSFPENLSKPARTVMATLTTSSREAIILGCGINQYRIPTVREFASMMSFPIDYMFFGDSIGVKHTLVGNAVPPRLSRAFATAINAEVGLITPQQYIPINHTGNIQFVNLNNKVFPKKIEKRKKSTAKFKYHLPYMIINAYRVELTNHHSDFKNGQFKWDAEIHYSQGALRARIFKPDLQKFQLEQSLAKKIDSFLMEISPKIVSFNRFQYFYCLTDSERKKSNSSGPFELLDEVNTFVQSLHKRVYSQGNSPQIICDELLNIPDQILLGYYVLNKILNEMETKND